MIDSNPIELKAEDAADAQGALIELQAVLRRIDDARGELQRLFTHWGDDPVTVMRQAQARTIELEQMVPQAAPLGESLARAMRTAGHLSIGAR